MAQATDAQTRRVQWWALALTPLLRWLAVRHSVAEGEPQRTRCPDCDTPVVPGARSVSPLARCSCGRRLGPAPFTLEATTLALIGLVALAPWTMWERFAFGWWIGCWIVLACTDLAVHRLPNVLTFAAAAGLLGFLTIAALASGDLGQLGRAVAGGAILWATLALGAMFGKSGLGGGDARAGWSVGMAAGWVSWFAILGAFFLAGVLMALYGVWLVARRRGTFKSAAPFGPSLFCGTLLAIVLLQGMLRP